jgi:hypothetical protein
VPVGKREAGLEEDIVGGLMTEEYYTSPVVKDISNAKI